MATAAVVSVEEYLGTSYDPDCDFVDGLLLERNVGEKSHSDTQGNCYAWFRNLPAQTKVKPFIELRLQVAATRFRIPDLLVVRHPVPSEEVFTTPPYICIEVMSPDDTMSSLQERLDDYLT